MGRITELEGPLTRHVPGLAHPGGEEGTMVCVAPSADGAGELRLWAKGTNKSGAQVVPLASVLGEGTSVSHGVKPVEWGEWVRVEDLSSGIMIRPDIPLNTRTFLCKLLAERAMYRAWVAGDSGQSFEEFLGQHGRGDLADIKYPNQKE